MDICVTAAADVAPEADCDERRNTSINAEPKGVDDSTVKKPFTLIGRDKTGTSMTSLLASQQCQRGG